MEILHIIITYWLPLVNFFKVVLLCMLSTLLLGRIPHSVHLMLGALIQRWESVTLPPSFPRGGKASVSPLPWRSGTNCQNHQISNNHFQFLIYKDFETVMTFCEVRGTRPCQCCKGFQNFLPYRYLQHINTSNHNS